MVFLKRFQRAYTLIQLLMLIAIVALVIVMATTSLQPLLQRNRLTGDVNAILARLHYARVTAITTGRTLTMCPSADQHTCTGPWAAGQLVFVDSNRNHHVDVREKIIKIFPALSKHAQLTWHGFRAHKDLRFYPEGLGRDSNGKFLYELDRTHIRKIIVSRLGRARVQR